MENKIDDLTKWIEKCPDWLKEYNPEAHKAFDKLVAGLIRELTHDLIREIK